MTVKEFYELAKGVGEAEWEDLKGVIVGYCIEFSELQLDTNYYPFIFSCSFDDNTMINGLSYRDTLNGVYWGYPTPETLAKYLKK